MVLWKKGGRSGDGKQNNLLGWPNLWLSLPVCVKEKFREKMRRTLLPSHGVVDFRSCPRKHAMEFAVYKCIKIQRTQVFWRWIRLLLLCVNVFVSKLWFLHSLKNRKGAINLSSSAIRSIWHLLFCISKTKTVTDACFLWNILFDKTTLTILSTLMILLPLS